MTMKAVQYQAYGDYEENRLVELPKSQITSEDEVLVEMRAFGINPLDNTFRSGHFYAATPENLPRVGGQTGVGVVVESGSAGFAAGDRVFVTGRGFGLVADGTWREYVAAPASGLARIPVDIDDAHAVAFLAGAGYLTAYLIMTQFVNFKEGQILLAPGIGGSVGMEAVQLAKVFGASMAISTASTTEKADQAAAAGYTHVIDLSKEGLKEGVMRLTEGRGADLVIDGISGKLTRDAVGSLAYGGTMTIVGYAGGRDSEVDVTDLIWKAATIRGFTIRQFTLEQITAAQANLRESLAAGRLEPTIAKTFPLSQAPDAVRYLIEGRPFGRVVMTA